MNAFFIFYLLFRFYKVKQQLRKCWPGNRKKKHRRQKVCFQFRHSFHLVKQQYTKFLLKRIFLDFQWDTSFFRISNTFISNRRLKLAKNQAKAKQHPEIELLLFENYSLSSYILSSKTNLRHRKKCAKIRLYD